MLLGDFGFELAALYDLQRTPQLRRTGAGFLFVMLDALLKSGKAIPGQRILCVVPESGRAMVGFVMLEMVG